MHSDSLKNYNKTCQNYFQEAFKMGEKLLEQTRYLEYLDNTIQQKDIEIKKIEHKHDEEIVQIQQNSQSALRILEKKLDYYERNQNSKEQMIVNLKKELQNVRIESSRLIDNVRNSLGDIKEFHKLHRKILDRENLLIRNMGNTEKNERTTLKDLIQNFTAQFLENIDTGIQDIIVVSEKIGNQFSGLQEIVKGIKGFEKFEREVIKEELGNAKKALSGVKKILNKDQRPFGVILKSFKELCQDCEDIFEKYRGEVEEQVKRYHELIELKRRE